MSDDLPSGPISYKYVAKFKDQADPFVRVIQLAQRLGVDSLPDDQAGSLVMCLKNGQRYDVIQLMVAFLDKMERTL